MIKILSNTSFISARMLAEEFRTLGENCLSIRNPNKIKHGDLVVRYGSTAIHEGINTINTNEVIRTCSNKLIFSEVMQENGLYTPIFYRNIPTEFPVIVRTTLTSFGGRGMILVERKEDYQYRNVYWTPYISTDFELRIHILGGEIVRIFRKDGGEGYIRTSGNGWHFSLRSFETYPKIIPLVERICSIPMFSNSFYALDLGWDSRRKEYIIFEANSAPGLNEHTADIYARYILNKINSIYR